MKDYARWQPRCPFCLSYGAEGIDPDLRDHMRVVHGTSTYLWADSAPRLSELVLAGTALALTGLAVLFVLTRFM